MPTTLLLAVALVIPAPLKPWVDWALHGQEERLCPSRHDTGEERLCAFPGRLVLETDAKGGRFEQQWEVFRPLLARLPGDKDAWPQEVSVDGTAAVVVRTAAGEPAVELVPGRRVVSGRFEWDDAPEALALPANTALVQLTVNGQRRPQPALEADGRVFLTRAVAAPGGATDSLTLEAFRLVRDGVPLEVDVRLDLQVAGKSREVTLGPVFGEGATPVRIDGELPATLLPDGRLKLNVRPGRFAVTVTTRLAAAPTTLTRPAAAEPWPSSEIWAFKADRAVRLVEPGGAPAVDPQQTSLPEAWRAFPAFLVEPGQSLALTEKRRGDPDPVPDRLHLTRQMWLAFDGSGYAVRDVIKGRMSRTWRLGLDAKDAAGATLERAAVDGRDQLITTDAAGAAGVEVRKGTLAFEADLRLPRGPTLPATGWDADFQSASAALALPPGWRLVFAGGVDGAEGTWLKRWNLLNLFVALVVALAFARLRGRLAFGVALAAMILIIPESDAPRYVWLALIPALALLEALPDGKLKRLVRVYHGGVAITLALICFVFALDQVRTAIYPTLAKPYASLKGGSNATTEEPVMAMEQNEATVMSGDEGGMVAPSAPPPDGANALSSIVVQKSAPRDMLKNSYAPPQNSLARQQKLNDYDPNAVVQTGRGLPSWSWERVVLSWSGPVDRGQELSLWLLSPAVNAVLAFLRVALLLLLVMIAFHVDPRRLKLRSRAVAALLPLALFAGLAGMPEPAAAADYPTPELLADLRTRLLAPESCLPGCADVPRLRLDAEGQTLKLTLDVHTAARVAIPLPGHAAHWLPDEVTVNGQAAGGLRRDDGGTVWLTLPEGRHKVLLAGRLPDRESVQIGLPLVPHQVKAFAPGFRVEGLHENGLVDADLVLVRSAHPSAGGAPKATDENATLPPFVQVARAITMDLNWAVDTEVRRVGGGDAAVVIKVPLVPGERVTTAGVRVENGHALVNMGPKDTSFLWSSSLDQAETLTLSAPQGDWTEVWSVLPSPVWNARFAGVAPVRHVDPEGRRHPEWRPWPGEQVTIAVTRPAGIPGPSLAVDQSELTVRPGARSSDASLILSLRASRGGEHKLTLPDGAELQGVTIDGVPRDLRLADGQLTLPLKPGKQGAQISWRDRSGTAAVFRTPALDLGTPHVNASVVIHPPRERWVLWAGGDGAGPAVLFWSQMLVLLLAAVALAQLHVTPLRTHQWFLLGVGLLQAGLEIAAVVILYVVAVGLRARHGPSLPGKGRFNLMQLALAGWTVAAAVAVLDALHAGFFGHPDMQIAGNASSASALQWFTDRAAGAMPSAWMLSVPMLAYQAAMLAWALWFAFAMVGWSRWGYQALAAGGLWRRFTLRGREAPEAVNPPPPPSPSDRKS